MGGPKRLAQTVSDRQLAVEAKLRERLGKAIHDEREARGWSQEKLATVAGIHWTTVGKVERGRQIPSLGLLILFAEALGVHPTELIARALPHSKTRQDETVRLVESLTAAERKDLLPILKVLLEWRRRR